MRYGYGLGYLWRSMGGGGGAPFWMTVLATAVVLFVVYKIVRARFLRH